MMFKVPWTLGPLDMGPVISGYIGVILYAAAAVSVGLLISSLTKSQAISFFVTFFVLGTFWFSANLAERFLGGSSSILHYISFQSRLSGFMRGLIDSRDVIYFLSITVLSLRVSFRALERRKWA
jgi:ABC-2 type transport system permease protein